MRYVCVCVCSRGREALEHGPSQAGEGCVAGRKQILL